MFLRTLIYLTDTFYFMTIEIDNNKFTIRLYKKVAYFKAIGMHGQQEADFFRNLVTQMLEKYPHQQFGSLCNFKELSLSDPNAASDINKTIKKISDSVDYMCNAIVIKPKFFEIIKAFVFSFYLRNIQIKTKIFYSEIEAIKWIEGFGFDMEDIKNYIQEDVNNKSKINI